MIMRVFRAMIHDGKQDEFERFFVGTALPLVHSQPGLISVSVGKPLPSTPNEFTMVMVWESIDALKGFAGENWQDARIEPEVAHLLRETFVHHYQHVADGSDLPVNN